MPAAPPAAPARSLSLSLTPGGPVVPPNNLAQLLNTFATLKAEGRKPTAAAYNMLIKEAANYGTRRGSNAKAGEFSLGFEIALGAMRDAEAGGIELGTEALNELLRVRYFRLLR